MSKIKKLLIIILLFIIFNKNILNRKKNEEEFQAKFLEQREKQQELINQLKSQLEDLETYAYEVCHIIMVYKIQYFVVLNTYFFSRLEMLISLQVKC